MLTTLLAGNARGGSIQTQVETMLTIGGIVIILAGFIHVIFPTWIWRTSRAMHRASGLATDPTPARSSLVLIRTIGSVLMVMGTGLLWLVWGVQPWGS